MSVHTLNRLSKMRCAELSRSGDDARSRSISPSKFRRATGGNRALGVSKKSLTKRALEFDAGSWRSPLLGNLSPSASPPSAST